MTGKDLGRDGVLEQRIASQRFARLLLVLSLRLQEVHDLGAIRLISMKSFAQAAEVK